jgi:hypothetical protein
MSNECAICEKNDLSRDHDFPETPIDNKNSSDEDEKTIHHLPSEDNKDGLKPAAEVPPVEQPEVIEDVYPDGGLRAWLVVFGVSVRFCFKAVANTSL